MNHHASGQYREVKQQTDTQTPHPEKLMLSELKSYYPNRLIIISPDLALASEIHDQFNSPTDSSFYTEHSFTKTEIIFTYTLSNRASSQHPADNDLTSVCKNTTFVALVSDKLQTLSPETVYFVTHDEYDYLVPYLRSLNPYANFIKVITTTLTSDCWRKAFCLFNALVVVGLENMQSVSDEYYAKTIAIPQLSLSELDLLETSLKSFPKGEQFADSSLFKSIIEISFNIISIIEKLEVARNQFKTSSATVQELERHLDTVNQEIKNVTKRAVEDGNLFAQILSKLAYCEKQSAEFRYSLNILKHQLFGKQAVIDAVIER